jgi:ribosomal protein S18 acetylase RimI-like enzyme
MDIKNKQVELMYATEPEMFDEAKRLFLEYAGTLGVDLSFQNFEEELKTLPERYGPPDGVVIIAYVDGRSAGCAALHRLSADVCEMKRLYVRDEYRGLGIGSKLIARILEEASSRKYRSIRLDTLPTMEKAQKLYESFGFYDIEPYVYNPVPGTRYLERMLD